jgi:multiple sugar transport system substrate-binding protein
MSAPALRLLKRLGVGALVAAGLGLVVWTPGPAEPDDGRIHLRYWYVAGADDAVPYHARRFNEVQDRIVVEATPIPWQEHEKKIMTAVLSGDPPDVVSQFVPVVKWASRMALTPLDAYVAEAAFDSTAFFPALWEEMRWQGRTFALPVNSASYALFYNRALFRAAGLDPARPPATWAEVEEAARRLTVRDARGRLTQVGYVPDYGTLHATQLMAWQRGARFLSADGTRVRLASPEVVGAFQWLRDFYAGSDVDGVRAYTAGLGAGDQHGFLTGKLAMAILDMSYLEQIARFAPGLDYGVAMVPRFPDTPTASSAGSWWLAIPRGARHPEAAWAFMAFAVAQETQLQEVLATGGGLFPSNRAAAVDPRFLTDDVIEVFVRQMDHAHSPTVVPMAHDIFWREFYGAQQRVVYGQQTPEAALRQAEHVVQGALDRALAYDRYVRAHMDFEEGG